VPSSHAQLCARGDEGASATAKAKRRLANFKWRGWLRTGYRGPAHHIWAL